MTHSYAHDAVGRRIGAPATMAAFAADGLRAMIVSGELAPGERVVETRLAERLGVSRPPLREAMTVLETEGLLRQTPRSGAVVAPLGLQDVYEIVTLRASLEEMAVRLGVPVHSDARLDRLRDAIETMEANARLETGEDSATHDSYSFHLALVGLSGHERLEAAYRSMALQLLRYMNLNRRARAGHESLVARAARHRVVFDRVAAGDADAVLAALQGDESLSFVRESGPTLERGSAEADAWLAGILRRGNA